MRDGECYEGRGVLLERGVLELPRAKIPDVSVRVNANNLVRMFAVVDSSSSRETQKNQKQD